MAEVDASGMRDVMREAIRIASSGTRGFHVSYSPTATEMPGWPAGSGGMTVRETHQAMEAIALTGRMLSMDVSPIGPELDQHAVSRDDELRPVGVRQADPLNAPPHRPASAAAATSVEPAPGS